MSTLQSPDFELILSGLADLFFRLDAEGTILDYRANEPNALYAPPDLFLGKRLRHVLPPNVSQRLEDAVAQAVRSGIGGTIEYALPFPDGERTFRARLLVTQGLQVLALVNDTTEQEAAERSQRYLAQVSQALAASLDLQSTLQRVARLAVPTLGDACLVAILEESRSQPISATAHCDPVQEELLAEAHRCFPFDRAHYDLLTRRLSTGRPVFLQMASDSGLEAIARATAHLEFLRESGWETVLLASLSARGEQHGILAIASSSRSTYTQHDMVLVEEFARRAALALDNARLYEAERRARAAAQAAERRMAFLAEAGRRLSSTLDYGEIRTAVARLTVPDLADWCLVDLPAQGDSDQQIALAHTDVSREAWLRAGLEEWWASRKDSASCAHQPTEPLLVPHLAEGLAGDAGSEKEYLQWLLSLGAQAVIVVPIAVRGILMGTITLVAAESGRRFSQADLELAEELGRRVGLALDNARLYQRAQAAIKVREDFLAAAAHELKTPVTGVRGYAQLMRREMEKSGTLEPERLRRGLQVLDQQTAKLAQLVTQLLDTSRLDGGWLVLERHKTDVVALVRHVVAVVQLTAPRHTLTMSADQPVEAFVDPLRLEQVVANLLDNAIKFSLQGGAIEIDLATEGHEQLRLAVRDHGIGIPAEHRQRIFDRFYRAHAGNSFGGLGLGLYISRRIVELHGGQIVVDYPQDGGTRFVVRMPLGRQTSAKPAEGVT
ncbi:MAG: ATP-binding protein [Anaerolineae bacterium]